MQIHIYPYNPTYPHSFETVKSDLHHDLSLANLHPLSITHIGSTAVPDLIGKNVIDVLILIPAADFRHVILERFKGALMLGERQGGYHYIGDGGVQGRWSFKLNPQDQGVEESERRVDRHVYVVAEGSLPARNYVAVRDTLRRDLGLREEYGAVKLKAVEEAGEEGYDNIMQYATKKNGVVRKILRRAGWSAEEIDEKEKQAVTDWPSRFETGWI